MSAPSVMNPWYVVLRLAWSPTSDGLFPIESQIEGVEYYTSMDGGASTAFQTDPKRAMIFMSLHAASRVAAAEVAWVRVLTTKEEAAEFGRD